jgi:hypothetical protein
VKPKAELVGPAIKPAERRLIKMLVEAEGIREKLAFEIIANALHRGLETERILDMLVTRVSERLDAATLGAALEERDRKVLFEVLFEQEIEHTWEEAEACLDFLRNRQVAEELAELEKKVQAQPAREELVRLLERKDELRRMLSRKQEPSKPAARV